MGWCGAEDQGPQRDAAREVGFLLINFLALSEGGIKAMLAFTQVSIEVKDMKSWCRKHEMKVLWKLQSDGGGRARRESLSPIYEVQFDPNFTGSDLELMGSPPLCHHQEESRL